MSSRRARVCRPPTPRAKRRQIARLRDLADEAGLDPQFAEKFLNFVIAEVIHHHEAIAPRTSADAGDVAAGIVQDVAGDQVATRTTRAATAGE